MRKPLLILIALVLFASLSGMTRAADEDEHAAHTGSTTASPADPLRGMKEVEGLMAQITAISEPARRRELLASHLSAMRDQMRVIRAAAMQKTAADMKGANADDPHAGHGEASDKTGGKDAAKSKGGMMDRKKMGGGMMKKHQQVEQRLDLLERMLQQLIEHEAIEREFEEE